MRIDSYDLACVVCGVRYPLTALTEFTIVEQKENGRCQVSGISTVYFCDHHLPQIDEAYKPEDR